jgi:hypothetical protein
MPAERLNAWLSFAVLLSFLWHWSPWDLGSRSMVAPFSYQPGNEDMFGGHHAFDVDNPYIAVSTSLILTTPNPCGLKAQGCDVMEVREIHLEASSPGGPP